MKKRGSVLLAVSLVLAPIVGTHSGLFGCGNDQDRRDLSLNRRSRCRGSGVARRGRTGRCRLPTTLCPNIDMEMAKRGGITSLGGAKIELIFKDHEATRPWAPIWPSNSFSMIKWWASWALSECRDQDGECGVRAIRNSHDQRFIDLACADSARISNGSGEPPRTM